MVNVAEQVARIVLLVASHTGFSHRPPSKPWRSSASGKGKYQMLSYFFSFNHYLASNVDVNAIGVYRSSGNESDQQLFDDMTKMIDRNKIVIISGDVNIDFHSNSDHFAVK